MTARSDGAELRLTTAQALVRFLIAQWTEMDGIQDRLIPSFFGIFGHGNATGLGQALWEHSAEMPFRQARNEQGMVHTALAFARARRRLATLACTSSVGPGATNMVTGAATATVNRLPVLLIPGDVYASRRQGNVLQQVEQTVDRDGSVNDCFRPVSRFFDRISRPDQLADSLLEAMRVLTDPAETGAVTLALPQDVGPEVGTYPARLFRRRVWRIERRPPAPHTVDDVVGLLASAQRPMLIAGGGVHYSDASGALEDFAVACGIPVAETFAGKGSVTTSEFVVLLGGIGVEGTTAANEIAARADVVVCVGTRLADFVTASRSLFQNPDVRFVAINISPYDASKLAALPVVSDAREALEALASRARAAGIRPRENYLAEARSASRQWTETVTEHLAAIDTEAPTQGQIIHVLNEHAQSGDTVVAASGAPPGDLLKSWSATGGRHCQIEFGNSCMGHEIPGAIGVRLARGEGEVFAYLGDGAYLLNPGELLTAVQEGLKITAVILNNQGYQVIRRLQLARLGHDYGNELRVRDAATNTPTGRYLQVDLAANAESLGARAWWVRSIGEFRDALREARDHEGACVIVVDVDRDIYLPASGVWWDVAPPATSADAQAARLREDYEQGRLAQRFYG